MLPEIVAALECPCCRSRLERHGPLLRCRLAHVFDVARSGYVSFLVGRRPGVGDSPSMVAARARILGAGHFDPLSRALAGSVEGMSGGGIAVEIGAGTARHLARVVDALPDSAGLAVDVSSAAARRAARAHPRVAAIVADARHKLPLARAVARVVLVAFAPRNGAELRRIVRSDGALVVATPLPEHLEELRSAFGMIGIDPAKAMRLAATLSPHWSRDGAQRVTWSMDLEQSECEALVAMGPSARHSDATQRRERARMLPERLRVTGACSIEVWRAR